MPKVRRECAGVLTIGGQLEAVAVTQHVAMDQKAKSGGLAGTGHHPLIACRAEQRPMFRVEDVRRMPGPLVAAGAMPGFPWPIQGARTGLPPLACRTCRRPVCSSMSDQRRATSSEALSPCR